MVFEYLRYFVETYQCGSLSQASKKLFVSQQGISQGIKKLENSFSQPLFTRSKNKLVPNEFGEEVYKRALPIIELTNQLEQFVNNSLNRNKREITVSLAGRNKFSYITLMAAHNFQNEFPDSNIKFCELNTCNHCEVFNKLRSNELDVAWIFNECNKRESDFNYITIYSSPVMLAINKSNPLYLKENLYWEDLSEQYFIYPAEDDPYANVINENCNERGFKPKIKYYSTENIFMAKTISNNEAVALLFQDYAKSFCKICPEIGVKNVLPEMRIDFSIITYKNSTKKNYINQFVDYVVPHLKASISARTV
jgi:DNA-binding transcriptional LysR family regulator